jgi:hypothetical protein
MKMPSTILAAAVIAAGAPMFAGPATAAPLSNSLALHNSNAPAVETVQYRRHAGHWRGGHRRGGGWIGPAVGAAAGLAIGSALAAPYGYYEDSYNSYAYAPGYSYSPGYESYGYSGYDSYAYAPRVRRGNREIRRRADPSSYSYGDSAYWSAYPSWQR